MQARKRDPSAGEITCQQNKNPTRARQVRMGPASVLALDALNPFQRAFYPDPDESHDQDAQEDQHFEQAEQP